MCSPLWWPTGKVRLNIQITRHEGIVQFLGSNNRDAVKGLAVDEAQALLDALIRQGITVNAHALGVRGLRLPHQAHAYVLAD